MVYGAIDLHMRYSQIRIIDETGAVVREQRIVTAEALTTYGRPLTDLKAALAAKLAELAAVRLELPGAAATYGLAYNAYWKARQAYVNAVKSWLVKAAESRPTRVTSVTGAVGGLGMATAPGVLTRLTRPLFRRMDRSLAHRTRKR